MEKAIVLYCDILGFTKFVDLNDGADNSTILNNLQKALSQSLEILQNFTTDPKINFYKESYNKINYKLFSDNLYVSISYDPTLEDDFSNCFWLLIYIARTYQESMLRNQILIRGGISFGDDFTDKNIIFSPALIKAYKIENEIAIYPRIVIDYDIISKLKDGTIKSNIYSNGIDTSIISDWTITYFVNPINVIIEFDAGTNTISEVELANLESQTIILNFVTTQVLLPEIQENYKIFEKNLWNFKLITWIMYAYYDKNQKPNELGFKFYNI